MIRRLLILFILIGFTQTSFSQEEVENELWLGYTAKFKISNHWKWGLKTQQRYNENWEDIKLNLISTNLTYKINDHFGVKADYRHTWIPEERNVRRYTMNFLAKTKIDKYKLRIGYRARVLSNFAYYTNEFSADFRNKLTLQHKLTKKLLPFASYELFYGIDEDKEIRNHRYTLGLDYRIKKKTTIKSIARLDQQADGDLQRIIGVSLIQSFWKKTISIFSHRLSQTYTDHPYPPHFQGCSRPCVAEALAEAQGWGVNLPNPNN